MRFDGKTALVTGAYRGIGFETARLFARRGASVAVNARRPDRLAEAVETIRREADGGQVIGVLADVSSREEVRRMFDRVFEAFGRCDFLVNNAAVDHPAPFLTAEDSWWDEHMRVNLDGVFYATQLAARRMVELNEGGAIVNLSSIAATQAHRNCVAYDTTKGGVEAFTRAVALELAPWDIRVNAISPASVVGHFVPRRSEEQLKARRLEEFPALSGAAGGLRGADLFFVLRRRPFYHRPGCLYRRRPQRPVPAVRHEPAGTEPGQHRRKGVAVKGWRRDRKPPQEMQGQYPA